MSVNVIFVMPAGCGSAAECPSVMREAYNAAVVNGVKATWAKDFDDCDAGTTGKSDVVIFDTFDGELYNKVLQSKSLILRPHVLLECITRGTPIPRSSVPLVSLALEQCVVVATCVPKEIKRDLKRKVQSMSGQFSLDLVSEATHLITDGVRSEKFTMALKMGIHIMRVEFINALWEASQTRAVRWSQDEFLLAHKCPVFLNLRVSATGFGKEDARVRALVERHGGRYSATMDVHKTDVLVCRSAAATASAKYKSATKYGIACVAEAWLADSVEHGYALPNFADYAASAATSTPTKPPRDHVEPNFSQMSVIAPSASPLGGRDATATQIVEQTVEESALVASKRKSRASDYEDVVDGMDVRRAKMLGLYLDGCVVFLAGFRQEHAEKLAKILQFSGAFVSQTLNDRVTHAIVGNPRCVELRQIAAKSLPCAAVDVNWLNDSMSRRMPVDVDGYLLSDDSAKSAASGASSPLPKKGLSLLRANVTTIMDVDSPAASVAHSQDQHEDDDVLEQYKNRNTLRDHNTDDDALAAFTLKGSGACVEDDTSVAVDESVAAIFAGLTFAIVGHTPKEVEYLTDQIADMRGVVVSPDGAPPDYAVVPVTGGVAPPPLAANVVTYIWLSDCADSKRLIVDRQYYHEPHAAGASRALADLCLCFSGLAKGEKDYLAWVVAHHGGRQQDCMSRHAIASKDTAATTHLVTNEPSGKKYDGALKWGVPVVGTAWVLRCAAEGRRVDEQAYLVGESKGRYRLGGSGVNATATPSKAIVATPDRVRSVAMEDSCRTPSNALPASSLVTPVNEIMARVRQMCGGMETPTARTGTPSTPASSRSYMDLSTPESPYGACFQNPPPPEVRKYWKRWLQKIKTPPPQSPEISWSEIKRRFDARLDAREARDAELRRVELFPSRGGERAEQMDVEDTENETNDPMLDQLEQLETHMKSLPEATAHARRPSSSSSSARVVENEGGAIPEKESQPMTVGWDENMVVTAPSRPKRCFMISGVDVEARARLVDELDALGASVSGLPNYDPDATHLLCERLNRNEKLLAALASGLWVLHASYASDSAAAGRLLNEEDYEFGDPRATHKFKLDADGEQRAAAARHWRLQIGRRGYGAFHDVRAIVLGQRRDPMVRVLRAGGAIVVDASPPFEGNFNATHCFVDVKHVDLNALVPLAEQGIVCASALYVNDFLQRTGQTINDFIIPSLQKYY